MNGMLISVMAGLILCYALTAGTFVRASITAPMLSVVAGVIVFSGAGIDINGGFVHVAAEMTLVAVLFHDASTVHMSQLRRDPGVALRLLMIGFPLAIAATYLATVSIMPAVGVAGAWLVAAAITPTDAGLGAPTVLNPVVPLRARRGLSVESGFNDGLATPIVLMALALLAEHEQAPAPGLFGTGVLPLVWGLLSAALLALAAAWCLDRSRERHLSGRRGRQVATLALPVLLFGVAQLIGANPFVAAFVGGLVFGSTCVALTEEPEATGLLEVASDLLGFVVWFLFGGLLLLVFATGVKWEWILLALLALTVLRIVPVTLAMVGTGFRWQTVAFLGWFGPRGLVTIVFGLLTLEVLGPDSPVVRDIDGVLSVTVLISVFVHGLTAGPLASRYGEWAERTHGPIAVDPSAEPLQTRGRAGE